MELLYICAMHKLTNEERLRMEILTYLDINIQVSNITDEVLQGQFLHELKKDYNEAIHFLSIDNYIVRSESNNQVWKITPEGQKLRNKLKALNEVEQEVQRVEPIINLIKSQIKKLDDESLNFDAWKSSALMILSRILGEKHRAIKEIESISRKRSDYAGVPVDNIKNCKKHGKEILETCINEIINLGFPEKNVATGQPINFNLTQTQNNNQTVNINLIISALESELSTTQLDELREISKTNDSEQIKKKKFADKLKGFGKDLLSNVLANVLTNPDVWKMVG